MTGSKRIRGTGHRTKCPQNIQYIQYNIYIIYNREIFRLFFFSLLCFLSVLIFKHKKQTNRSSVIASLIEYDRQTFDYVRLLNRSIRYAGFTAVPAEMGQLDPETCHIIYYLLHVELR